MLTIKSIVSTAALQANRAKVANVIVLSKSAASYIAGTLEKFRHEILLQTHYKNLPNISKDHIRMLATEYHSNASDEEAKCDSITEEQQKLADLERPPSTVDHYSYNIINENIYMKHKVETYNLLTSDLTTESFSSDEEKYQTKTSKIIEIFYSLDESLRPKELRAHDIDYMVKMKKPVLIKHYMKKLAKKEKAREKKEELKSEIKEAIMSKPKDDFGVSYEESGKPVYKVHSVSPICSWAACKRMRQHNYAKIAQYKLLNAQKVVIDFDYNDHMTLKEHLTITAQIKICIGMLRKSREPVDLYFCNFDTTSPVARFLELDFGPPSSYLVEASSKSYFDLFPKEKLVYLTADTDNVLQYDPDDIYIIGGMIDAQTNEPVSAMKAEKEGLRTAKLPLNEYVRMRNEVKSLKISQVFGILSRLSSVDGNMKEALEQYIAMRIQSDGEVQNLSRKHSKEEKRVRNLLKEKYSLSEEEVETMMLLVTLLAHLKSSGMRYFYKLIAKINLISVKTILECLLLNITQMPVIKRLNVILLGSDNNFLPFIEKYLHDNC